MANKIIKPKDKLEWLALREAGIGSSEVATVLGLNKYETPYQLWRRKKGIDPQKTKTFAMLAGNYLEDAVTQFWMDKTGREVIKSSAGDWLIVNTEKEFLRVSPDRTYWLSGSRKRNNKGILECKTTQKAIDVEDIPQNWFCQLQYQLGVAEFEQGSLAWLSSGREFNYRDFTLSKDFYRWMVEEVTKFYTDYIIGDATPEPLSSEDIILLYSKHTENKYIEVSEDIYNACDTLKFIKDEIFKLEERQKEFEEKIKLGFGDAEGITFRGETLATWKTSKPTERFDTKTFRKEHPDLAKHYTTETQGARRFLLKI